MSHTTPTPQPAAQTRSMVKGQDDQGPWPSPPGGPFPPHSQRISHFSSKAHHLPEAVLPRAPKNTLAEGCSLRPWHPGTFSGLESERFPSFLPAYTQKRAWGLAVILGSCVQGTSGASQTRELKFSMLLFLQMPNGDIWKNSSHQGGAWGFTLRLGAIDLAPTKCQAPLLDNLFLHLNPHTSA